MFFKWIKQHLRIKAFYGLSPNALRSQGAGIAISVYVLVAIVCKDLGLLRVSTDSTGRQRLGFRATPLLRALPRNSYGEKIDTLFYAVEPARLIAGHCVKKHIRSINSVPLGRVRAAGWNRSNWRCGCQKSRILCSAGLMNLAIAAFTTACRSNDTV